MKQTSAINQKDIKDLKLKRNIKRALANIMFSSSLHGFLKVHQSFTLRVHSHGFRIQNYFICFNKFPHLTKFRKNTVIKKVHISGKCSYKAIFSTKVY